MQNVTRKTDKTKRRMWRDEHRDGLKDCHAVTRRLAFLLYSGERSIVDIFKEAGVATCMLHHWVSGKSNPQIRTLSKVLDVMGYELVIQKKTCAK